MLRHAHPNGADGFEKGAQCVVRLVTTSHAQATTGCTWATTGRAQATMEPARAAMDKV